MSRLTRADLRAAVQRIGRQEALRDMIDPSELWGPSKRRDLYPARHRAWRRILDETGCSVNALAGAWGCHHETIRYWLGRNGIPAPVRSVVIERKPTAPRWSAEAQELLDRLAWRYGPVSTWEIWPGNGPDLTTREYLAARR